MTEKFAQTDTGTIWYCLDRPYPDRPTMVFLHGLSSNHTTWLNIMEPIKKAGWNVLALDLRGHGHSDKTRDPSLYHFPRYAEDLAIILEQESITDCVLVGYSFGGPIAVLYTQAHPKNVQGLVLISTNYVDPLIHTHFRPVTSFCYAMLRLIGHALRWQDWKTYTYYQHGKEKSYLSSVRTGFMTMPLSINLWMLSQVLRVDLSQILPTITAPTLLFCSPHDPFLSHQEIDEMKTLLPNATVRYATNPSHFVASAAQDEVVQAITSFIQPV